MSMDRTELLGAWLVAGLALAVIGIVPLVGARQAETGYADVAPARSSALTRSTSGELPFEYDAEDFGDWLSRRRGGPPPSGPTDADS
jgi:hypothetical protein